MAECIVCGNDFSLPKSKSKLEKQYHSTDSEMNKRYMCEGCFTERSESEFRIIEGVTLCADSKCARNSIVFSKYCEICHQEKKFND